MPVTANLKVVGTTEDGGTGPEAEADDDTSIKVSAAAGYFGIIKADERQVEVGDDVSFKATLYGAESPDGSGGSQGSAERVIVLPRNGDKALGNDIVDYDGHDESKYDGSRILKSVSFDSENTSAGATLYYTTKANPGIDPDGYDEGDWHEIVIPPGTPADADLTQFIPEADLGSVSALRVAASQNAPNATAAATLTTTGRATLTSCGSAAKRACRIASSRGRMMLRSS